MAVKVPFVTILLSLLAGFVGGLLGVFMVHVEPASAVQAKDSIKIIEAGEFRLVDKEGRVRAILGIDNALISFIRLFDLEGHTRVSLSVNALHETAGIYLYDDGESLKTALHTLQKGASSLSFYRNDDNIPWAEFGNELGSDLGPSAPYALKFWKGGALTGALEWHAP